MTNQLKTENSTEDSLRPNPNLEKEGALSLFKRKERRAPLLLGLILICLVVIGGGIWVLSWLIDSSTYVTTDYASIDGSHVNISSKILGQIKEMLVEDGTKVSAGQELIILEDADLRAQEKVALAAISSARANLELAKVNQERAANDFKRALSLFQNGALTKEQYENSNRALFSAEVQYDLAQAQLKAAQAQLGIVANQLLNTVIRAPIPGVIARLAYSKGDVVQPSQTICIINDLSNLWITANFEETQLHRLAVGADAEISIDAYPQTPFKGRLAWIAGAIVPPPFSIGEFTKTTQRIPVRITFTTKPDGLYLLPGMSAVVKVHAKQ